ncbi:hypothetical protein KXD40_005608 [Peronospora effusa]|uniref:Uncharacterized protein n=1 Tax=Peronospora effusa TaxID=542832 RepID=A0A3M6VBB9_9STRA|nr:hypothetical protein DD238_005935 [Peronospora effusa]UIZ27318.1 hypothetical protein KXD40_005608 [Peronospora effusa]CAI5727480.1 unnamed protein product [Peronospora effusa]
MGDCLQEFNAKHNVNATVTQLRAKFRYLQDQFFRVRGEKIDATKDSEKVVVYPRYWELLLEHFENEEPQRHASVDRDDTRPISNDSQIPSMPVRRRKNSLEVATIQQNQQSVVSSNADAVCGIAEKLEVIHTTQREMARFLDSIKESMDLSNEAIRGLQQRLNQSNQVNATLLEFLQR